MKALVVNMTLDPVVGGGTAQKAVQLAGALVRSGLECSVLTVGEYPREDLLECLRKVSVVALRCVNRRYWLPRPSLGRVLAAVNDSDIIVLMNHWTLINLIVCGLAKLKDKPYVVCPAGALVVFGRSKMLKRIYNALGGRRMIRSADGLIATTRSEIAQFEQYGVAESRVTVIPNAVSTSIADQTDGRQSKLKQTWSGMPFILFVGRLHAIKGPDLLLRAFANLRDRFPRHRLVVAGPDDGMLPELLDAARGLDLEGRVFFPGFVDNRDKFELYRGAELVVIPSRFEAMSLVVLEAGLAGTPVVLTDRCGFDEVESVGGGRVVSATVQDLEKGIREMLDDRGTLIQAGERLRRFVVASYGWESIAGCYVQLFHRVCGLELHRMTGCEY